MSKQRQPQSRQPKAPRNIFRALKSHLQKHRKPKNAIFNISDKIIFQISHYLDLVDRACLSLSCKKYLYLLSSIRTHRDLYKQPCFSIRHTIRPDNRSFLSDAPVAKLCARLQNEDWVFCRTCRRLHTRDSWGRQEYARRVREREQARETMRVNRASAYMPGQPSAMLLMTTAMFESDYYQ